MTRGTSRVLGHVRSLPRYDGVVEPAPLSRADRKELTRQAILAAALALADQSNLASVSLRRVAGNAGIVPTAFYRHFDSIEDVGLALVGQSFEALGAMLRDARAGDFDVVRVIESSVQLLVRHTREKPTHFRFISRERTGGPAVVREAIDQQLRSFEHELTLDLARLPGTEEWSAADLDILAHLIVTVMVATAESILATPVGQEAAVVTVAEKELRMLVIGARSWRSRP